MQHDPRAWLWDICAATDSIAEFVRGRNLNDYLSDAMLRSAVERQFEVIGEALSRLSRRSPEIAVRIPDRRKAVAMRNALAHGYDKVDHAAIWQTAQDNLPSLRARAATLLAELGGTS